MSGQTGRNEAARVLFVRLSPPFPSSFSTLLLLTSPTSSPYRYPRTFSLYEPRFPTLPLNPVRMTHIYLCIFSTPIFRPVPFSSIGFSHTRASSGDPYSRRERESERESGLSFRHVTMNSHNIIHTCTNVSIHV